MLRGSLVAKICDHMLHLPPSKENAALTLMNADVGRLASTVPTLHDLIASAVTLILGIYFLTDTVAEAAFLAIFPVISMSAPHLLPSHF